MRFSFRTGPGPNEYNEFDLPGVDSVDFMLPGKQGCISVISDGDNLRVVVAKPDKLETVKVISSSALDP